MRFLLVALIACRGNPPPHDEPPAPPTPTPPPLWSEVAGELEASARRIHDTTQLAAVRSATTKPEKIERVVAQLSTIEHQLIASAALVRTGKIADAIDPLANAVETGYRNGVGTLPSDLVDELVDKRDRCKTCPEVDKLRAGYEAAKVLAGEPRRALTDAAVALYPLATDVHTKTVLDRAVGAGPSFGAPCGPEDLCAHDQMCVAATRTCERECFEGAMEPCPGNRQCVVGDAGLTGVCR